MLENCKMVVIDNNEDFNKGLKDFYSTNDSIEIFNSFENIDDALEFIKNNKIDIVLTDLVLQNGDGFYLIEQIKTALYIYSFFSNCIYNYIC